MNLRLENLRKNKIKIYRELRDKCREDFSTEIVPKFRGTVCEFCKNEFRRLQLHHSSRKFVDLLGDTLEDLEVNVNEDISDVEIKDIRKHMLDLEYKTEYKTLCPKCHKIIHDGGYYVSYKDRYNNEIKYWVSLEKMKI